MLQEQNNVMMENDTPIYVNKTQIENVESYIYLDRDTTPETKTKTRRFKEESRPYRQHSPSTATSSRVTMGHVCNSCVLPAMAYKTETWALAMHPSKEQASSRTCSCEDVKHHIPRQNNKHLGKRKDKGHRRDWSRERTTWTWAGQVSRIRNNWWTPCVTIWKPYT